MKLSVVSPVYMGEKMINELISRIEQSVRTITDDYEIILVNDKSPDNSWLEITRHCSCNRHIKGIDLSRNFGQHYAISAGLAHCSGDWIVVLDCDLQDRPEEIPNLYNKAIQGWDIVQARRCHKKFGIWKRFSSWFFHKVFNWLSGLDSDESIGNYGIYSHKVIEEVNKMPEIARSFGSLTSYVGFRSTVIDVEHAPRAEGRSSYSFSKLFKLAFNIVISNSNKPLRLAVSLGLFMSTISFVLAIYNILAKWLGIIQVAGYTTTVFSIWFVGGLLLLLMGIIGLYIGKIFDQVKGRQIYIISEKLNFDE